MAAMTLVNPKKRTKRRPGKKVAKRRSYRRNPASRGTIANQLQTSAIGAGGAFAVDMLMAKLPIPLEYSTGTMGAATQGLVSIGLGMAVHKFTRKKKLGMDLAQGGLTVAMHGVLKSTVGPSMALSGMDESLLGYGDVNSLLGGDYYDNPINDTSFAMPDYEVYEG